MNVIWSSRICEFLNRRRRKFVLQPPELGNWQKEQNLIKKGMFLSRFFFLGLFQFSSHEMVGEAVRIRNWKIGKVQARILYTVSNSFISSKWVLKESSMNEKMRKVSWNLFVSFLCWCDMMDLATLRLFSSCLSEVGKILLSLKVTR